MSTDKPILHFKIENTDEHLEKLTALLSPSSFQTGKNFVYKLYENQFDYNNRPLLGEIKVKKQAAKRHFGVHGYFTRQSRILKFNRWLSFVFAHKDPEF